MYFLRLRKLDFSRKCSNKNLKCEYDFETTNIGEKLTSELNYDYRAKNDLMFTVRYGDSEEIEQFYEITAKTEENQGDFHVQTPEQNFHARVFGLFEKIQSDDPKSVRITYDGQEWGNWTSRSLTFLNPLFISSLIGVSTRSTPNLRF